MKTIRKADALDKEVDRKREVLVEKPDGSVVWLRSDGTEQKFIRDN